MCGSLPRHYFGAAVFLPGARGELQWPVRRRRHPRLRVQVDPALRCRLEHDRGDENLGDAADPDLVMCGHRPPRADVGHV
jgi:hypothetical protein